MEHKGTQLLTAERLRLRRILPEDAEDVFGWMGDPEVCKYERFQPHPNSDYSRGYILEAINYQSDRTYHWGMELDGRLIGSVCVVGVDDHDQKGTLGYCIRRQYWNCGYATEAVKAVFRYLFTEVGLNRIEASHAVQNIASGRVLEKCGMTEEGLAKEYYRANCGIQDSRLFGLIKSDYLRQNGGEAAVAPAP